MSERLQGIEVFVKAVECGSFARAAERLNMTRSAVAKAIARLESRLGTRLFRRTTRSQSLTELGQHYYEHCVRALSEIDAANLTIESRHGEPGGRLRMTVPVLFGRQCIAPLMVMLARRHPCLSIDLHFSDRVVDLVEEGFDLGVRVGQLGNSTTLVARRLGSQRMVVCAAPSYLARRGGRQMAQPFADHDVIVYSQAGRDVPWRVLDGQGLVHEPKLNPRLRFDDLQAIADAAVGGAGLAWLPCWLVSRHVLAGELSLAMAEDQVAAADIHAVWPRAQQLASKTRAAVDALLEGVPQLLAHPYASPRPVLQVDQAAI